MDSELKAILETLTDRRDLSIRQARWAFDRIMAGDLEDSLIGALLGALRTKGECVDELVGAAEAMRARVVRIHCKQGCIDTCGTGGDGVSTFNVSTTAAIVAAAAGATVAKHGNRSTSRASGSTEVLTHLGIDVEADPTVVERCLAEVGIGYLNARTLHPAMKRAAPVRKTLPVRTIFNLLGPLTNPAGVRRQVVGVPRLELLDRMAEALLKLGAEHAWVVHGDGLCDLSVTGESRVMEVRSGRLTAFSITPEEVGLRRGSLKELLVDSPAGSAQTIHDILAGAPGAPRDHALMNAGAALVVAGLADELGAGVTMAAEALDDGRAIRLLDRWRSMAGLPGRRTTTKGTSA